MAEHPSPKAVSLIEWEVPLDQNGQNAHHQGVTTHEENGRWLNETTHTSPDDTPAPNLPGSEKQALQAPAGRRLYRSFHALFLVSLYAILAILAWTITCVLSERPINAPSYGAWIQNTKDNSYSGSSLRDGVGARYARNERWYRAARILQEIVTVFTIPLTSAVCSSAAVVFVQRSRRTSNLTLRQAMALADRGWTDSKTYTGLISLSLTQRWKKRGSTFLFVAILLCVLGVLIGPLQQGFLLPRTIKTPTELQDFSHLHEVFEPSLRLSTGRGYIMAKTRAALSASTIVQPQNQLWPGSGFTCDTPALANDQDAYTLLKSCDQGTTFGNFSRLPDPFFAELPSGFHTGLVRQFLPRTNSTANFAHISTSEFPQNCQAINGSFFANYFNDTVLDKESPTGRQIWGVQACMPEAVFQKPWKYTRERQEFSEELFLNVSLSGFGEDTAVTPDSKPTNNYFRVNLKTTAGFFELPNYMNGGLPGPLLPGAPNTSQLCGNDCAPQFELDDPYPSEFDQTDDDELNKGPLFILATALFGNGSYFHTLSLAASNGTGIGRSETSLNDISGADCASFAPLVQLTADEFGGSSFPTFGGSLFPCVEDDSNRPSSIGDQAASWLSTFNNIEPERLSNAFTAAAFLANQARVENTGDLSGGVKVLYDMGGDTNVPTISRAGIIFISILIVADLIALFALALYAASPRCSGLLDALMMLQYGSSLPSRFAMRVVQHPEKIKELDELPGWIGDGAPREGIGRLEVGGLGRIRTWKPYACYDGEKAGVMGVTYTDKEQLKIRLRKMREGKAQYSDDERAALEALVGDLA